MRGARNIRPKRKSIEENTLPPSIEVFRWRQEDNQLLDNWKFNSADLPNMNEKYRVAWEMFYNTNFIGKYILNVETFAAFIHDLQMGYNNNKNPFHNFDHGLNGKPSPLILCSLFLVA